jgi:hypothetical protein
MWHLDHLVQIQKARKALKSGNLDEAFSIASREPLRDFRQCQEILELLVEPFLSRARDHLAGDRVEDALADVERALAAGGNRPAVAELREQALAAFTRRAQSRQEAQDALASARKHIAEGRLAEGEERLAGAPPPCAEEAEALRVKLEKRRRQADVAAAGIEACLERGDLEGALAAGETLASVASGDESARALLDRLAGCAAESIARSLTAACDLAGARHVLEAAGRLRLPGGHLRTHEAALQAAEKAARAVGRAAWSDALVALDRFDRLLPGAAWVASTREQLEAAEKAVRGLRAGPLGDGLLSSGQDRTPLHARRTLPVPYLSGSAAAAPAPRDVPADGRDERGAVNRFLLWVDGIGSYLVLPASCVTIGRAGSSARPDIGVNAAIEGCHARVVRVEHDYFLAPNGPVTVNGAGGERHLLADGDKIVLAGRTPFTFRLPTALSSTAVLEFGTGLDVARDVTNVVLLDGHIIFGPRGGAHVPVSGQTGRIVLSFEGGEFRCRSPVPLVIGGAVADRAAAVPVGASVEAGALTFTITRMPGEGRGA